MADAKDELSQTQKDREYDIRKEGYQGLSDDLNSALEDTLDEVKYNSSKQEQVISEMLNHVVNNYKDAYDKINQIIGNTGFKPSDDFQQNIGNLGTQSGANSQIQDSNTIAPNYTPDDFVSGTNTGQIQSGSSQSNNDKIESEIEKEPNTTNRPIAQLTVKPTSISIQEGQSKNVSVTIRPTDAANKTLKWTSSNSKVATASNGTIKSVKPGSCQITVSTTDGSGISATVAVTVTAKPKPKPPAPKPSGGDGIPRVGDKVTFTGSYYYDSWGQMPAGNLYSGVAGGVVIDGYSGSEFGGASNFHGGYGIHIRSADGRYGDLGWVSLNQISGYAKGTRGVKKDLEFAKINEIGNELIIRRGGNDYTTLTYGSAVVPHNLSSKLFTLAEHTNQILNSTVKRNNGNENIAINNHYDSLLTVNGNVDRDALPGLEKLLQKSYEYTSKRMYKDAGLMGIQKKL
ncbi:Ig-like domain-containing protein [[Ruminococcus] torques]|uniref:Ig-like domain-containing protein n=1 Tax=[Ruminococcus] torques TaxID=33039 RepID=UPI003AF0D33D